MGQRFGVAILVGIGCFGCYPDPMPVELTTKDNGRDVGLALDQEVAVTLQTIGPGQFGKPDISSAAVRFEGMTFPTSQNPGGPTQLYRFRTVADGTAIVTIPHDGGSAPFTLTLRCCAQ